MIFAFKLMIGDIRLLHTQNLEIFDTFCYSNQQTDWAYDLGSELLNNFGPIWDYLCSNGDLPNLSLPATNFLKSANLFLGFGSLFVVEGAELTGTLTGIGGLISGIGVGSLATACLFALPVLFISIEPVGEPDGYVENYWDWNYPSHDDPYVVYPDNVVQIQKSTGYYDTYKRPNYPIDFTRQAPNYFSGISMGFEISNSGPDDENSPLVIKIAAGALISLLLSPGGLFVASGIKNHLNFELEYDKEDDQLTIAVLDYKWSINND